MYCTMSQSLSCEEEWRGTAIQAQEARRREFVVSEPFAPSASARSPMSRTRHGETRKGGATIRYTESPESGRP